MRRGVALFLDGVARLAGEPASGALGRATATRVVRAWRDDLLGGYAEDPTRMLAPLGTRFTGDLVALRDLEFSSVCRHHLLPFTGRVHLAYAPAGRITGLSRLAKLVGCLSRRLQLQEPLTREIVDQIQRQLRPEGAACVIEATHACMTARGERRGARIVTAAYTGIFLTDPARRREAAQVLQGGSGAPSRRRGGRRSAPFPRVKAARMKGR